MKEAVYQSCSGKGFTVAGSDHILLQHLALVTASVICEVSVPSPGRVQGTTQEYDVLSCCLYRRGFMQHLVCLVLKATCSRMLVLLGLVHQAGTGSSELSLGFCALGCCGATT